MHNVLILNFSNFNPDANLSKDGVIIAHISIALNRDKNVNDEILLTKSIIIYPKENFNLKIKPKS